MEPTKDKYMEMMSWVVVVYLNDIISYKERDDLIHRIQLKLDALDTVGGKDNEE